MDRLVEDPLSLALLVLVLLWWRLSSSASFSLEDKVVLITGAGNGIGKRLAEKIAHETKRVTLVLLDINEDAVKNVRDQLKSDSATVFAHKCDVSDNVAVNACVQLVLQEVAPKQVDVLVNNAGIVSGRPILELTPAHIRRTFEVNTLSHFWFVKALLPSMIEAKKDAMIVTVASVMGIASGANLTDYCASKAATIAYHESLRLELWRDNNLHVKTLLVCPSAVDTGMFDGLMEGASWSLKLARFIMPKLNEVSVAGRILKAIQRDEKMLITCATGWRGAVLPWVPYICRLLPVEWFDYSLSIAGSVDAMNGFVHKDKKVQ